MTLVLSLMHPSRGTFNKMASIGLVFRVVVLIVTICSVVGSDADYRDMVNGRLMYSAGYMDQPYCVVTTLHKSTAALSRWVCVVTLNNATEGKGGEHIASFYSEDQGTSWHGPVPVNPDLNKANIDNSYSAVILTHFGRIYAVSNANLDNVTSLPSGEHVTRTDEFGYFLVKHSDDGGETWDPMHTLIPYRSTEIDQQNTFKGKTKIFWNVDQFKERNSTVYAMFTKIGAYMQNPPEEGFVIASSNILTEQDPTKITWEMLPEGDHGPGAPSPFPRATTVAEEWHVMPLVKTPGFFAVFRTNVGILGASWTSEPTGRTGWTESTYAEFAGAVPPGTEARQSMSLKNPRGPITLKRFSNGRMLMLWYVNSFPGFASQGGRTSRNPYWLSAAYETPEGKVVFSQPEIILYNRTQHSKFGPGYPDFIEDVDGSLWIMETQKVATRAHRVPQHLWDALENQPTANETISRDLALSFEGTDGTANIPSGTFPDLSNDHSVAGFTVDFWVQDHSAAEPGDVLLSTTTTSEGAGIEVIVATQSNLTFSMSDGKVKANITTDTVCTSILMQPGPHHVSIVADGGPNLLMFVVDNKLCDGSWDRYWGWEWFDVGFQSAAGNPKLQISPKYSGTLLNGKLYRSALLVSESISNFRAKSSLV